MIRVLHVQRASGVSGSERHLLQLFAGLAEAGVDVRLLVLVLPGGEQFAELAQEAGASAVLTTPARHDLDLRTQSDIGRAIAATGPDLVHTHLIHADLYGQRAAAAAGVPGVSSVHSSHRFYERWPIKAMCRRSWASTGRVIAISEHVGRFLTANQLVAPDRLEVIPYGVDPARAQSAGASRLRAELELSGDSYVIGVASRLVEHKGHDVLLDAMRAVVAQTPHAHLVVAGRGPLRRSLEARASSLGLDGKVSFVGHLDDISELFGASDTFVFPSLPAFGEGFGLAALEAMVAGLPVVASRTASLPEIVQDGVTGLLVEPGSVRDLADALVRLADPLTRAPMASAGAARARRVFSRQRMVDSTLAVYRATVAT